VKLDRAAGRLAIMGAALGVLAGLVDVAAGPSIRDWVGNKLDTTRLGIATLALSAIALAAAIAWQRPGGRIGGRRLATVLALALPAAICFTTIGRMWYVPGVLLLAAAGLILAASTRDELAGAVDERRWLRGLIVTLGAYDVFLGADALGVAGVLGILGGVAIWAALSTTGRSRRVALTLLVLGALPFAVATWWSVVTPLIALLVLAIGVPAVRQKPSSTLSPPSANRRPRRSVARFQGSTPASSSD
jgi:hypothetical protein